MEQKVYTQWVHCLRTVLSSGFSLRNQHIEGNYSTLIKNSSVNTIISMSFYTISLYRWVACAGSGESPNRAAKKSKISLRPQIFIVHITYAAEVSLNPLFVSPRGSEVKGVRDVLRVLNIVLRQKLANQLSLLLNYLPCTFLCFF